MDDKPQKESRGIIIEAREILLSPASKSGLLKYVLPIFLIPKPKLRMTKVYKNYVDAILAM